MTSASTKPTCFIAMPITTHPVEAERYNGDEEHWDHVMRTLFVPSIEAAGFEPIEPTAQGSDMIHGRIIEHLVTADMVLCDLSSHNPNVFFELGVRTSLNKPIALVVDEHTKLPFDTSGLNTQTYASTLRGWELAAQIKLISNHLVAAVASCGGENPMWRRFGLNMTAERPVAEGSATDARIELILGEINELRKGQIALQTGAPARQEPRPVSKWLDTEVAQLGRSVARILGASEYTQGMAEDGKPVFTYAHSADRPFAQAEAMEIGFAAEQAGWHAEIKVAEGSSDLQVILWARSR